MAKKKDSMLVRITQFFFVRWRYTLLLWIFLLGFGAIIYTNVIKREGFPPIQFPLSFVSGVYVGQDEATVDADIVEPISSALAAEDLITDIEAAANDEFFSIQVVFDSSLTSQSGTELVQKIIDEQVNLPPEARLSFVAIDPGSLLFEYDLIAQVYSTQGASLETIDAAAVYLASELESIGIVEYSDAKLNLSSPDQSEGQNSEVIQTNFSRVGIVSEDQESAVEFYNGGVVGVAMVSDGDVIILSEEVNKVLDSIDLSQFGEGMKTVISADFARDIDQQINFLQSNILTGLLAVALVSLILISWRASIITALFMVTVMLTTIIILYIIGYSLNVITLFGLILSLGLFVDDATIVVESIDVNRRKKKLSKLQIVKESIRRVGPASLSGTLTTILVFAILASPTGILGAFIRLIPITVMIALVVSFLLSITLIPFLSKFIMLKSHEVSWLTKNNPVLKFEYWLSEKIEKIILSIRLAKGKIYAAFAVLISVGFVIIGFYVFAFKIDQNIFPPPKDADQIGVQIQYAPGTTVAGAQMISEDVEEAVVATIGENVVFAYYGAEQLADAQQSTLVVDLVSFTDRAIKAPELIVLVEESLESVDVNGATVTVGAFDNGPPSNQFPFGVRVYSDDVAVLDKATKAISDVLVGQELENYNGDIIVVEESKITGVEGQILRGEGRRYAITKFSYNNPNPTLVSLLSEEFIAEALDEQSLDTLGLTVDDIVYDTGQEGDFNDSFKTLLYAIPIAMFLMYLLLAVQFRSIMQPFLILLAIPFTIFGVAVGLNLTDNSASFFVLTGFIGLIGIAVNNTIMLTDYANQERRAGKGAISAIASASRKRFRPLIATTLTTVVALLPLALSDPFWEALSFTIIFGLISSTILVIISFPYYYLGAEWLRMRFSRGTRKARKANKATAKA